MAVAYPNPATRNPLVLPDGQVHEGTVFLKPAIDHPRIEVGDYTYASSHEPPDDWAARLAPYIYPVSPERLIIGKFCQIAHGVQFVTTSANHRYDGFSSFPFAIFDGGDMSRPSLPDPLPEGAGDTCIGHDVWIGTGAMILPSARIGNGVIIGAGAVVAGDVPSYSIVAGNPARVLRRRFDAPTIARLEALAWWDWPIEAILQAEAAICSGDLAALEAACPHG